MSGINPAQQFVAELVNSLLADAVAFNNATYKDLIIALSEKSAKGLKGQTQAVFWSNSANRVLAQNYVLENSNAYLLDETEAGEYLDSTIAQALSNKDVFTHPGAFDRQGDGQIARPVGMLDDAAEIA